MKGHFYIIFFLLVFTLLATLGLVILKEMNPGWKRTQAAYYKKEIKMVSEELKNAAGPRRADLQKRLRYLSRPKYEIKQILLDGGSRADRCITCHLDLKALEKKHPQIKRFPFEQYGCSICHGGVGRATELSRAHSTLRIPPRPLYEYLEARSAKTSLLDLFRYSASGQTIKYTGSNTCLGCHLSSHPRHVARWRQIKFNPLDKVKNKLQDAQKNGFNLDQSKCLSCHTTAFNEQTGRYLEGQVTCESCHGPGEFYAGLMAGGRARDGAELARANILETRADRVCLNCHKPDRHNDYTGQDIPPTLIAAYLGNKTAPKLDGRILEPNWNIALETKISTWQLYNESPSPGEDVFVRALYNDTDIYLAFRWRDKTRQEQMGQWVNSGGKWQANLAWPDALALHWQITPKVKDFGLGGCAVLCHSSGRFKNFPRMATRQEGALVDEWYWNAFTAALEKRPGDGFLDHLVEFIPPASDKPSLRWSVPKISAAHGSDASGNRRPDTVGGISLVLNVKKTPGKPHRPQFHLENERPVVLHLHQDNQTTGRIPLYLKGVPEKGDSADIQGKAAWVDGYWTLEIKRALQTSSKRDVRLEPDGKRQSFGLALWDGAPGERHQVATRVGFRFEPRIAAQ